MRVLFLILSVLSFVPAYAQSANTGSKPSEVKLIIGSDPSDADVYIDDKYYGKTPLKVEKLSPGTYNVKIKKESFKTVQQKVECPVVGYAEHFSVLSQNYALLNLESTVSGADVFIGDSLLGKVPLENVHIPLGRHTILVKSKDFQDWILSLNAAPTKYSFKAVMKYSYGYVTLVNGQEGSEIFIDDKEVEVSKLDNYRLEVGNHKIEVRNPVFSRPLEEDLLIGSETKNNIRIESNYFSYSSFFKSLFIPGLGQYQDNARIKGISIFSGALISGTFWIASALSASDKNQEYDNAKTDYAKPGTVHMAFEAHNRLSTAYDNAKKANRMKNISMGTFLAVYAYNILDVLLFHSRGQDLIIKTERPDGNSFNIGFSMAL